MPNAPTQKQPVFGSRAVVAANQPIASAAGIAMLAAGGNVADAAVATAFTCGVVEPQMVGPMGGGYVVFRDADGGVLVIDNYAEAASAATDTLYEPDEAAGFGMVKGDKNQTGHLATGVPGNAKGWLRLHELKGRLPLAQVLQPAIDAAEHGFEISPYLQYSFRNTERQLAMFPESAKVFLVDGKAPPVGHRLVQPELAESLRAFAKHGSDAFYHGPLGEAFAAEVERGGGIVTMDDIEAYEARYPRAHTRNLSGLRPHRHAADLRRRPAQPTWPQHPRELRRGVARLRHGEVLAPAHRGAEDYVRRQSQVPRRPQLHRRAPRRAAGQGVRPQARVRDTHGRGGAPGGRRPRVRRLRPHDAPDRYGGGRLDRYADDHAEQFVRRARRRPRHRLAHQQQHGAVRPAPRPPQLRRPAQADAHRDRRDHRGAGRQALLRHRHAGRHPHLPHGAPGHHQRARPRDEHPGRRWRRRASGRAAPLWSSSRAATPLSSRSWSGWGTR